MQAVWLPVIGKSLAYLCLRQAEKADPKRFDGGVLQKVRFLTDLGLPTNDAAEAAGSTAASVAELKRQKGKKKGGRTRGTAKKKR
jgi:hypothetical protein